MHTHVARVFCSATKLTRARASFLFFSKKKFSAHFGIFPIWGNGILSFLPFYSASFASGQIDTFFPVWAGSALFSQFGQNRHFSPNSPFWEKSQNGPETFFEKKNKKLALRMRAAQQLKNSRTHIRARAVT
jgi:hypothetical protein